ncbi:MAG TPA: Ig-like domain-containing protein [Solirubrobacteraceae bacterium]|nr:Ig-like domain-containing protein [Solirubrobacteraceae bacterium]
MFSAIRARRAPSILLAALALALVLPAAAPAAAVTHEQATHKALAALGAAEADGPVIVFALPDPLRAGSRVTQGRGKRTVLAARERALFFYQDRAPAQPYPHPGRVALVGLRSGKVRLSRTITRAPRVNGRLPAFLRSRAAYGSSRYRVFELSRTAKAPSAPFMSFDAFDDLNSPPTAAGQELVVKEGVPKRVTLTATDADEDPLTFHVIEEPRRGKLSGQPPDLVYTPARDYLGPDEFVFVARDDDKDSEPARIWLDVVPLGEPPTITTSPGCTAYAEQQRPVAVDRELTVFDPDDRQLDRATVRIDEKTFQNGDELLITDQNGIFSSYDADTGVLSLTGTASVEAYLEALRSVAYRNDASASPAEAKYIEFVVNDAGLDSVRAIKQLCIISENDPPIGETSEAGLVYVENDGQVPVDGGFVVGDPDSASLSGATIEFVPHVSQPVDENGDPVGPPVVTHSFSPAEDELAFTDQRGITGSYDDANGLLKLRGRASLADYEAAIRSVTYENSSEDPSEATRRLQFQVTDDAGASSVPVRRDAFIAAIEDAPRLTPSKGWTDYIGKATPVDDGLRATDLDDSELEAAEVRIVGGFVHGDTLEYADQLGISGHYDPDAGILTLKGTAPVADYETALRSVAYDHTAGTPTGWRTVELVAYDGEVESAAASKVVEINDQPVLEATREPLAYTPGEGWVRVDDAIWVGDPESTRLVAATVAIARGFSPDEDELMFEEQNGIAGEYDDLTGVLTLRGEASVADYEAALRSVLYENWSKEPWTRTVTFQVDDGAGYNNLSEPVGRDIEIMSRR